MKKAIVLLFVASLALFGVLEAGGQAQKKVTIGLALYNLSQDNVITWVNWLKEAADQYGVNIVSINADMVPSRQEAAIAEFINRKVDGIFIAVSLEPHTLDAAINEAVSKGIPVITVNDNPRKGFKMVTFGVHWYDTGYDAAAYACKEIDRRFGGKANVALLTMPQLPIAQDRTDGQKAALAKFSPNSKIVAEGPTDGTQRTGLDAMARLLRAHPEINTILGVNDESAIGAIAALRAAGKNPADYIITGVDAEPQASALIKKGEFTASVTVYTKGYAYLEMYVLRDLAINGDKSIFAVCREIYEESPLITKDNVDAYMEGQGWNKK